MAAKAKVAWKKKPEQRDFDGALAYLNLVHAMSKAVKLVRALRRMRVSGTPCRSAEIRKGKGLPPVLLIRGEAEKGVPLTVADGYHRICAICYFDENAPVACCLV